MANLNLSGTFDPTGGNQFYSHIQAHGTPSAFEPGYVQSAQNLSSPSGSPFQVVDVNVDLSAGAAINDVIALATSGIPYGCEITAVSFAASGSIPSATTEFQAGYARGTVADPDTPLLANFTAAGIAVAAGAQPGAPSVDVNGGVGQAGLSVGVTQAAAPDDGLPQLPVVVVTVAAIPATPGATLNAKIVYFCP